MYLNKVYILGRLTRKPELKVMPQGTPVSTFSIATNSVYKDSNGNKKENVEYHNIVAYGKQAETIAQYLDQGQEVLVVGRMTTRSWEGKDDGIKRYKTEIITEMVQFGTKAGQNGEKSINYDKDTKTGRNTSTEANKGNYDAMDKIDYPEEDINPEDIPF